uniref:Uncharacterized protein MANES_08G017700 n=1 Tax=Rhizophora mucronata TaxID=61149 RepID=A0A2P2QHN3_RHIMU
MAIPTKEDILNNSNRLSWSGCQKAIGCC